MFRNGYAAIAKARLVRWSQGALRRHAALHLFRSLNRAGRLSSTGRDWSTRGYSRLSPGCRRLPTRSTRSTRSTRAQKPRWPGTRPEGEMLRLHALRRCVHACQHRDDVCFQGAANVASRRSPPRCMPDSFRFRARDSGRPDTLVSSLRLRAVRLPQLAIVHVKHAHRLR